MSNKEKLYLFQEISKAISSTLALNEIIELIVKKMAEVLNLKGCTIRLVNPRTNILDLVAAAGVLVLACHPDNCKSHTGNEHAHWRVERAQALLAEVGVDPLCLLYKSLGRQ